MKNKSLIIICIVFALILGAAILVYPSLSEKANEEMTTESTTAQDNSAYPLYSDVKLFDKDGNEVHLSDFIGKPVILNFWATWCGYCIQEMPDFEEAYKEYGDEVQFLIVNTDDGIEKGEQYISSKGYSFPTYYDLAYSAAVTYGISGIPRTIAIDKDGRVLYNRAGMVDADMLESIIEAIK